jgi:outer membrane lipoprotein-sorting protein
MKLLNINPLIFTLSFLVIVCNSSAQDAGEILKKMDDIIFAPKDKTATVQIVTYKNGEEDKVREAELLEKGPEHKIYRYTKPESQAGIATLSLPGDIMWMKMPAFDKPKKISMLAKSQALNNTDFAWEDIPRKPYSERFEPSLTKTESDAYILELVPKSEKSGYSRLVVFINNKQYYPLRIEYYDKGGRLEKFATYSYQKIGNYWNASEVTMTDMKKKSATRITMTDVRFDQGLSDAIFTEEEFWK